MIIIAVSVDEKYQINSLFNFGQLKSNYVYDIIFSV